MVFSEDEKFEIVSLYIKNNNNASAARREYIEINGEDRNRRIPSKMAFKRIYSSFQRNKSLKRKRRQITLNEDEELEIYLYYIGNIVFLNKFGLVN